MAIANPPGAYVLVLDDQRMEPIFQGHGGIVAGDELQIKLDQRLKSQMAHFTSYNTNEANTKDLPLDKNAVITLGPIQTDLYQKISGYIWAEKAGELFIEQAFDYDAYAKTGHWDISEKIAITAETVKTFSTEILAPVVRIRFKNGATAQKGGVVKTGGEKAAYEKEVEESREESKGTRLFVRTFNKSA